MLHTLYIPEDVADHGPELGAPGYDVVGDDGAGGAAGVLVAEGEVAGEGDLGAVGRHRRRGAVVHVVDRQPRQGVLRRRLPRLHLRESNTRIEFYNTTIRCMEHQMSDVGSDGLLASWINLG